MKRKKTLKIGLTGGIGAGKTIISKIFYNLGVPIYYADEKARYLMNNDEKLINDIKDTFGANSFKKGELNKAYLAEHIFNDPENLKKMNSLVHPRVREDYHHWHEKNSNSFYTIKEAALLFESGSYQELDKTILVCAPEEMRIERVLLRDRHRTREDILKIIKNQMPENEKKQKADFIINNNDKVMVVPQVLKIHQELISIMAETI